MAGSLKDQLLKAGLVSKHQVRSAESDKRKGKGGSPVPSADLGRQAQGDKAERDRELNRVRQQEADRKANAAAIKQLIETHRVAKGDGDLAFNFVDGSKVRRVHVTREIHAQLVKGALCPAKLSGGYELVPLEVAEKIHARDPARVILPSAAPSAAATEADPYAAYQVPDDLMW